MTSCHKLIVVDPTCQVVPPTHRASTSRYTPRDSRHSGVERGGHRDVEETPRRGTEFDVTAPDGAEAPREVDVASGYDDQAAIGDVVGDGDLAQDNGSTAATRGPE